MLSRDLLRAMGFRRMVLTHYNHEVWYHDYDTWVHFSNEQEAEIHPGYYLTFNNNVDQAAFFAAFFEHIEELTKRSARVTF